jgi:uncharacterized lipoprotein YddW (UPF0748 family)
LSDPLHLFLEHPDWVVVDQGGADMPYGSGTRWISAGHPGVRRRLARVASEIARDYPVDGIHLDFIRYPGVEYSYDIPSMAAFDSVRALEPGLGFDDMRRRFVTWAVEEVRDSLYGLETAPELSAAVWGVYRNILGWSGVTTGFDSVFQDAREWDRLGIVDALVPMVYWPMQPAYGDRLDFAYLADEHALAVGGSVFIGMNVHDLDGRAVVQQMERARMAGVDGVSVFSYSGLENGDLWGALRSWAFFLPARRSE